MPILNDDPWYKNAIIYCLDVEKFMDVNGDGVGDFEGLSRRLEHLASLGVTCVWLQPTITACTRSTAPSATLSTSAIEPIRSAFASARSDPKSYFHDWYVWADKRPKAALCKPNRWIATDCASGQAIDLAGGSAAGWDAFRKYRNRAVSSILDSEGPG